MGQAENFIAFPHFGNDEEYLNKVILFWMFVGFVDFNAKAANAVDFSDISEVADEDDDKKMKEAMSSLNTLHTGEYDFDKITFEKKKLFTFNNLFRCLS